MTAALIAMDWGTSSCRAWLLDQDGAVLDELASGGGILNVEDNDFDAAFEAMLRPWFDRSAALPVIASGMISSRNGWQEQPYLGLPVGADALAAALGRHQTLKKREISFVTGVIQDPPQGSPDVMRGEETEVIGHLAHSGQAEGVFVLPGTHSKWVRVEHGEIINFATCMTGEGHALLMAHSILGRVSGDQVQDHEAFRSGVVAGQSEGPLLSRVFSARTLVLTGRLPARSVAEYLSGLLIADEIKAMAADVSAPVQIIGRGDLAEKYKAVLDLMGRDSQIALPGMARRGLMLIAKKAGLV